MTANQYVPALALIDRRTNKLIGMPVRIPEEEWPFVLPVADTPLIRYVDYWKLEHMINQAALFFCYGTGIRNVIMININSIPDSVELLALYFLHSCNFLTRNR